jgi:hypothetical protein
MPMSIRMPNGSTAKASPAHKTSSILLTIKIVLIGAWIMHPILILVGKMCFDTIPGMSQQASWTLVNLGYLAVSIAPPWILTTRSYDSELIDFLPDVSLGDRHSVSIRGACWSV